MMVLMVANHYWYNDRWDGNNISLQSWLYAQPGQPAGDVIEFRSKKTKKIVILCSFIVFFKLKILIKLEFVVILNLPE